MKRLPKFAGVLALAAAPLCFVGTGVHADGGSGHGGGGQHDGRVAGLIAALGTGSFTVGLTTVVTDAGTQFGHDGTPFTFADLKVGDAVVAEGAVQADGSLLATRVDRRTADPVNDGQEDDSEISGTVGATAADSFTVGTTTVTVDAQTVFEVDDAAPGTTFTLADLTVGAAVEVEGVTQPDGSLLAREVSVRLGVGETSLDGVITAVDASTVEVDGIDCDTDANASIEGQEDASDVSDGGGGQHLKRAGRGIVTLPLTLGDLHVGQHVRVSGILSGGKVHVSSLVVDHPKKIAKRIRRGRVTFTGPVSDISAAGITVNGVVVSVGPRVKTNFRLASGAPNSLVLGQSVTVRGAALPNGEIRAARIVAK